MDVICCGVIDETSRLVFVRSTIEEFKFLDEHVGKPVVDIPATDDANRERFLNALGRCALTGEQIEVPMKTRGTNGVVIEQVTTFSRVGRAVLFLSVRAAGNRMGFTERELEVVSLLSRDMTVKEIAAELGLSPSTVDTHRQNAMHRAGVNTTHGLIAYCLRHSVIVE